MGVAPLRSPSFSLDLVFSCVYSDMCSHFSCILHSCFLFWSCISSLFLHFFLSLRDVLSPFLVFHDLFHYILPGSFHCFPRQFSSRKGTGLSGRFLSGLGEPTRLPGMTGSWVVGVPAARCQSWRDTLVPSLAQISGRAGTLSEAPH